MGFFSFLDPVLDFLLGWTLNMPPLWGVILISFIISLIIVVVYKYTTNQNLMKQLKEEMKAFQNEMKQLKAHPEQAMAVQKKAMETNMKYMMQSFKSTLYTILPIILIFGWLNLHWAFAAVHVGEEFTVNIEFNDGVDGTITTIVPDGVQLTGERSRDITDGSAIFTYKGVEEGIHTIEFRKDDRPYTADVLVTEGRDYEPPVEVFKDGPVSRISVGLEKLVVLNLFGWRMGWLAAYIIFSIAFSLGMRKLFKVY